MELSSWLNLSNRWVGCLDADTGIGHLEAHTPSTCGGIASGGVGRNHPHRHGTVFGELDGVANEVQQDLAQPRRISATRPLNRRIDPRGELDAFLPTPGLEQPRRAFYGIHQVEIGRFEFELSGIKLRDVEDVIDDAQQRLGGALHHHGVAALLVAERGVEQQPVHPEYAIDRRPHLMAHVGNELALGHVCGLRQFARLLGTLHCPASCAVRSATFCSRPALSAAR